MKQTLYDLFKATINATLLLLALCLFLGWKLMSAARAVTEQVSAAAAGFTPVQDRIAALQQDLAGLRTDLGGRPAGEVAAKLEDLDARLAAIQASVAALQNLPAETAETAARAGAAELAGRIGRLAACRAPQSG